MPTPPNLLLITSDQQHYTTLGVLNPRIKTPNLDRLAALGTHFTRAYCPNPTCTPTRASIITGQYPATHGAYTLGTKLPENVPTLGDYLGELGYTSSLIGKAHFQPLKSTDDCPSVEAYPTLRDLAFWKTFNDRETPWYGFDHVELTRNHTDEGHTGQHYALWLEEQGLNNWRDYFQPRTDGIKDTPTDSQLAPPLGGTVTGSRAELTWKLPDHLHYTAWTGQRTIAALEKAHAQQTPFFIWSSYHDPHPPYAVPEPWASMYDPNDMDPGELTDQELALMPPPHQMTQQDGADFDVFNVDGQGNHGYEDHRHDRAELKRCMAVYYAMVSFLDHWVGQTLDTLERLGLLDQTLIVFTSDHGHFLGQHGLVAKGPFHYEDLIRVPLIAAWPGHIPAGVTSDHLQSLVDLCPTFLAAAGRDTTPLGMQGRDMRADWADPQGDNPARRRFAMVQNHHNRHAVHLRTLVTDRYKLTVYEGQSQWGELFDLQDDPDERSNLFHNADHASLKLEMYEQFIQAELSESPAPQPRVAGA